MYMAMPSGNVVIPDKMHGGGVTGAEVLHHPQYHRQWVPDERDGFISWIRSEFAAANAIIDSMCHHLKVIGEPGEYDGVLGIIQQRRVNWYPVLHMQQYFSVTEVIHSLQQAAWRRQQQQHRYFDPVKVQGKRFSGGSRQGHQKGVECYSQEPNAGSDRGDKVSEKGDEGKVGAVITNSDDKDVEDKNDVSTKPQVDIRSKSLGNSQANTSGSSDHETAGVDNGFTSGTKGSCDMPLENGSSTTQIFNGNQNIKTSAKTFVGTEIVDGKAVNAVDGMKLYEELLDHSEVANLVTLVNDLRTAGRRGQFQGQTFVISPRPMRGHGREMIQLGLPIADAPPEDEISAGTSKDRRIEPIPSLLQNVIERLIASQIITVEPDSCTIDVFNEGDHSHPHMWPHWFGRPLCVLFLTECDMTFGKVIASDRSGDYKGSIKLSFTPGSMLVMQGRSTDFARHAIPALRKQRMLVTLTKLQPKRSSSGGYLYSSATASSASHWVPPPSRSPNHLRHPMGPKHHIPGPTTGVLPAPPIGAQLPPPNGVQPIFVPAAVAPGMPFPAPVALPPTSAGWPVAVPRHQPPRLPVPGTGVFLPPGSGNTSIQPSSNESLSTEAHVPSEKDNVIAKPNGNNSASPNGNVDGKMLPQDCNGTMDGTKGERLAMEEQLSVGLKVANEPAETV